MSTATITVETTTATTVNGWQAVSLARVADAKGGADYLVTDAATNVAAGEVRYSRRHGWRAYRDGFGGSGSHTNRADALAAVDWMRTVPVERVTVGAALVLTDGTAVEVLSVWQPPAGADVRPALELKIPGLARVELAAPRPIASGLSAQIGGRNAYPRITYMWRPAPGELIALAPPCTDPVCLARPGRACGWFCNASAR
jgi:hypothetical protein